MSLPRHILIAAASLGSGLVLLSAFGFQHIGGLAPCQMCLWQRWPHGVALALGIVALGVQGRFWPSVGVSAMAVSALLAAYHTGVERGWWEGPAACASGDISGLSPEALLEQIMAAPVVRCDEVPWEWMGLSMASWNGVLSLVLAGFWLLAARRAS